MKKIFIMNLGTTSFKFKLYRFSQEQQQVLASGEIESVGAEQSAYELLAKSLSRYTLKISMEETREWKNALTERQ